MKWMLREIIAKGLKSLFFSFLNEISMWQTIEAFLKTNLGNAINNRY
jgi:hypothetical protein